MMSRAVRIFLAILLASGLGSFSGCDNKKEGQPNTNLEVPDVPPSSRGKDKSKFVDPTKKAEKP